MDIGGVRRLNRSSPSRLSRLAQQTDFFHGLLGTALEYFASKTAPRIDSVTNRRTQRGACQLCTCVAVIAVAVSLWAPPVRAQPPTCSWTDNPIVSGQTPIKAVHINELRACLDAILAWLNTTAPADSPDSEPENGSPRPPWFDESYWQQLVFESLENSSWRHNWKRRPTPGQVASMNFHIETGAGNIPQNWADRYSELLPSLIQRFTGISWQGRIVKGTGTVELQGWVSIQAAPPGSCASGGYWTDAEGWERGVIRLSPAGQGGISDWCLKTVTFAHELGHVLGFHHVDDVDDVMCTDTTAIGGDCNGWVWEQMPSDGNPRFTDRLLRHAQLAFSLGGYYPYPGVPQSWLAEPDGVTGTVDSYMPRVACTGRYWYPNSGGISFEVRILNNDQRPLSHDVVQQQYRRDASGPWTTDPTLSLVVPGLEASGFSTPLFTDVSSPPFQWRARSCPRQAQTDDMCSDWSNVISWTAASCAGTRVDI